MQYRLTKIRRVLKAVLHLLLFSLLAVVLLFESYTLIVGYTESNVALPATFGNFKRVRALLANNKQQGEFSFAVAGDIRGRGTFEQISEALKSEPLSFMLLLGDCILDGTPGYHRYLRAELTKELAMPFPVFYVVGNHDVNREKFPISEFEKVYGPTNFYFDYNGSLFIVLRILPEPYYSTKESLAFLESLLSARRRNYDKVFVFMHIPPPISSDFSARNFENPGKLVALFDKFNVDYVIAADYHGYARVKVKNTVYLVTGAGGAPLKKRKFGMFHHAIVIKVGPDSVSERILFVNGQETFEDTAEMNALAEVYPWLKENRTLAIILNMFILVSCFWAFCGFLRSLRSYRRN